MEVRDREDGQCRRQKYMKDRGVLKKRTWSLMNEKQGKLHLEMERSFRMQKTHDDVAKNSIKYPNS